MPDSTPWDNIHFGECLPWLRTLPSESVDCVISSPPYNIGKKYETRQALSSYLAAQTEILTECVRVLKDTGSIFWQVGSYALDGTLLPLDIRFFPILEDLGLFPRNRMVWVRQHGLHARNKFSARHEAILWFTKSTRYKFQLDDIRVPQKYQDKKSYRDGNRGELTCNPLGKNPGDVWSFQNVKHNHEEQTIHPAQFPEAMVARMMLATTEVDDVVLDPYMGAGTVAVVARDHGRHYLGAETDPDYYSVAMRRLDGGPDEQGRFPNLKTLRDYCELTGQSTEGFRFDVQVGEKATPRHLAKIYSEEHHLQQLQERLELEEDAFVERITNGRRGSKAPAQRTNGARSRARQTPAALFDLAQD